MTSPTHPALAPPVNGLFDFSGRVAVVTGAGTGLGAGIARRFSEAGAAVAVHYHTSAPGAEALVRAVQACGGKAVAIGGDLTRKAEAERLLLRTVEAFGRVDILINNSGLYPESDLLTMSEAGWDAVLEGNLRSVFLCTQAAAQRMIAQGGGGAIVSIASIEGANPTPGHSHYGAAKAAVIAHARAAAQELASHGIRVNVVSPGLIWRKGIEEAWPEGVRRWHARAPLERMGTPEDVADACLFLASSGARWITGANLVVDGGVLAAKAF
ncbi:MAG: glucose 1-dehydrogenase [Acidobacteriia bacterium]|nr:glucose 1-dehydrogenase [Terriglobia bacterium]